MIAPIKDSQPASPTVPKEQAGKWIAWNSRRTEILAAADRLMDVLAEIEAAGITDAVYEQVPPAHVRLVGGGCR